MSEYAKVTPQLRLECTVVSVNMTTTKAGRSAAVLLVDVTAQRIRLDAERTVRVPFALDGLEMRAWQTKTAQDLLPGDRLLCEVVMSVWQSPQGYRNLQAKAEDVKVLERAKLPSPPAPPPFAAEPPAPQPAAPTTEPADMEPSDDIPF